MGAEPKLPAVVSNGKQLSLAQLRLADWMTLPPSWREPKTLKALAHLLGVTEKTIHAWKRKPAVIAEVARLLAERMPARDPEVWAATVKAALTGDERDRRLYWELRGKLRKGGEAEVVTPVQVNVILRDE